MRQAQVEHHSCVTLSPNWHVNHVLSSRSAEEAAVEGRHKMCTPPCKYKSALVPFLSSLLCLLGCRLSQMKFRSHKILSRLEITLLIKIYIFFVVQQQTQNKMAKVQIVELWVTGASPHGERSRSRPAGGPVCCGVTRCSLTGVARLQQGTKRQVGLARWLWISWLSGLTSGQKVDYWNLGCFLLWVWLLLINTETQNHAGLCCSN